MNRPSYLRRHSRRLEEVDYWRARAGWVDDAMDASEYEDATQSTVDSNSGSAFGNSPDEVAKNVLKVLSIIVALGLSVLFFRAILRRMNSEKERKKRSSDNKSRSGSTRRSRSRSRSRKTGEYDAMKDDDEKSRRSTRSRSSRSRRSRSRSRTERSRSKSRSRLEKATEPPKITETVLV
jgi:hypothetical protein